MASWGSTAARVVVLAAALALAACFDDGSGSLADHPEIERVVRAAEAGDATALVDLIAYSQVACVAEQQGIGAPPLCEGDEIPGDTLDVLPVGQCEGFSVRAPAVPETMEAFVAPDVRFYGAYAFVDEEASDERVVVVFEETAGDRPGAKAIYLRGGRIYYVHVGCNFPDGASFVEFNRLTDAVIAPVE